MVGYSKLGSGTGLLSACILRALRLAALALSCAALWFALNPARALAGEWTTYLSEDFSGAETMFYTGQAGEAYYSVDNDGRYVVDGLGTDSDSLSALTDSLYYYYAEASCELLDSTAGELAFSGLVFHYNKTVPGKLSYYVFYTYGDGYYGAKRVIGDQVEIILPLTKSDMVDERGSNTLGVDAQGTRFDLYVNGKYIDGFTDVRIDGGGFGFYISKRSKAAFDDFSVKVERRNGGIEPVEPANAGESGESADNAAPRDDFQRYKIPDIPRDPNRPVYPWEVGVDKSRKAKKKKQEQRQEEQKRKEEERQPQEEIKEPPREPKHKPPPEAVPPEHHESEPGAGDTEKQVPQKKPEKPKEKSGAEEPQPTPPVAPSKEPEQKPEGQPGGESTSVELEPAPMDKPASPMVRPPAVQPPEQPKPQPEPTDSDIKLPPAHEPLAPSEPPTPPASEPVAAQPVPPVTEEPAAEPLASSAAPESSAGSAEPEPQPSVVRGPQATAPSAPPHATSSSAEPAPEPVAPVAVEEPPQPADQTKPPAADTPDTDARENTEKTLSRMRAPQDDWGDASSDSEPVPDLSKPEAEPKKAPDAAKPPAGAAEPVPSGAAPEGNPRADSAKSETSVNANLEDESSALALFPSAAPSDPVPAESTEPDAAEPPKDESLPSPAEQDGKLSFGSLAPPSDTVQPPPGGEAAVEVQQPEPALAPADDASADETKLDDLAALPQGEAPAASAGEQPPAAPPEPAAPAQPTPEPELTAPAELKLKVDDDFSEQRWPISDSDVSHYRYFGSAYEIDNLKAQTMAISYQQAELVNADVAVDTEYLDGESNVGYGLAARFSVKNGAVSYYALFITSSGEFMLLKVLGGAEYVLSPWAATNLISPTKTTRLALRIEGTTIRALINGQLATSVEDQDIASGGYALLVGPGAFARFDNLQVRQ